MMSEPYLLVIVGIAFAIIITGLLLKFFKQPHVITYILVGILLGPSFFGLIKDQSSLSLIGNIGIILLMFFVGMEVSIPRLVSNWKIVIIGPILQVIIALLAMLVFGRFLGWSFAMSVLMAFVITVSSTAVILKILKSWDEFNTKIGQDVIGILIVQDIMVVPMLLILDLTSDKQVNILKTLESIFFAILVISLIIYYIKKEKLKIPFEEYIKKDSELKFFLGLLICFGFASLTSYLGISSALGAFIAGILISEEASDYSIKKNLKPFYFLFVAIFFMSIGMLLDINFLKQHYVLLFTLLLIVFLLSTVMNTLIMRFLGSPWDESIYAGALLSQLGEFGFILAAAGLSASIITAEGYSFIIALIALTLLFSPFWILFIKKSLKIKESKLELPKNLTLKKLFEYYPNNLTLKKLREKYPKDITLKKIRDTCPDNLAVCKLIKSYPKNMTISKIMEEKDKKTK